MASSPLKVVGSDLMFGSFKIWHNGNLEPSWNQITNKPINIGLNLRPNLDEKFITTQEFIDFLKTNNYIATNTHYVLRGNWSYNNNNVISDGPNNKKIDLAGAVIEIFSQSTASFTIIISTAPTSRNGSYGISRTYVYNYNGDNYKPG